MLRIVHYRLTADGQWTEGVLHTFNDGHAIVENKATAELELVPVRKDLLKFTVVMDQWVKMQMDAQRQAQIQGVTAPNIAAIRR